jgi:hypothetical protein
MKICRVIFSTNRPEFLIPTLDSHSKFIDFGDHEVYGIFIDDYPQNRNDEKITEIAKKYGFNHIILHEENKGLTPTWTEIWKYLSTQDYDYIWHHEDDVVFQQSIKIQDLIEFLQQNKNYCQINLKRNPWYEYEIDEPKITNKDMFFKNYRYDVRDDFFWSMASLYPAWVTREPIVETEGCNLAEWPIMKYFREKRNMKMAVLKNQDGSQIVKHIGFYSQGKRVEKDEPGWDMFGMYDPTKKYDSKNGQPIT